MATICSCNNTTAASTHTSTPSSLASSTCGTNCHQTRWRLLRSLNSRTDLPPPRCIKSYYGPCFISTSPCTVFTSFTNVLMFTWILSLHTFYAYFTHGPNTSASAQYDNTRGAWLTQEGCTVMERKEGSLFTPNSQLPQTNASVMLHFSYLPWMTHRPNTVTRRTRSNKSMTPLNLRCVPVYPQVFLHTCVHLMLSRLI